MYNRIPRHSLFFKAMFLGVYLLFFTVQLYLRYSFSSCYTEATHSYYGYNEASSKQGQQLRLAKHSYSSAKKACIRLNKRFYPSDVFMVCALPAWTPEITVTTFVTATYDPVFIQAPTQHLLLLRGPPTQA